MNKENKKNNTQWWHRLGNVIYHLGLVISLLAGAGVFINYMWEKELWLPSFNSFTVFSFGATCLGIIVLFEIIRRVLAYVTLNKNILDKRFPKLFIILALLFIASIIVAGVMKFTIEPFMKGAWIEEQKEELVELEVLFEAEKGYAKVCLEEKQEDSYSEAKISCEAKYRKVKLGYDSCMKYGWREMCLQYDDYEIIDCSEETLREETKELHYYDCAKEALRIQAKIEDIKEEIE